MKLSEFNYACKQEFGEAFAGVVLRDHWLSALGKTASEALADGVRARDVWDALCEEFQVPAERRYGRGLPDPE